MDLKLLMEQVSQVARQAGALIRETSQFDTFEKEGSANFVTSADLASQNLVVEGLKPLLPGASFYMEENEEQNLLGPEYTWIIDPIDGTTNFMMDFCHSAISIALVKDQQALLGVVYNPYLNELFSAVRGMGAWCSGKPIHTGGKPLAQGLVAIGTYPYGREKTELVFENAKRLFAKSLDVRRLGSAALDICYVAAGRCVGFYEAMLSPWDFGGASVILEEAGGKITAADGSALRFDTPMGVLAANPIAYPEMRETITLVE